MKNPIKSLVLVAAFAALFVAADSVSAATVQFHLRHQNTIFFEGETEFPALGTVTFTDVNGVQVGRSTQSVLALLSTIDATTDAFDISKIKYYPAWDSLFVHCIQIQVKDINACDNWQYVVDGTYPYVGMDNYALSGGENVWIYFGDIRKAFEQQGSFKTDNPFSFSAEQYQYEINGWAPVTGYTIGIKKGTTVVATSAVDSQGKATFTVTVPGDYTAGIVQDFYFPSTAFYVDQFVPSFGPTGSAAPPPLPPAPAVEKVFDTEAAIRFLQTFQQSNNSISDVAMLNDWAAIAGLDMKAYLLSDPNPGNLLTDYERRAMALMAQSINPYSGTPTNYIEKILEGFDGTQFGSRDLANDDMFAVIPLLRAGYTLQDAEVEKAIAFILSWQQPNGSWGDVDNTAAAVQALAGAKDKLQVQSALDRAKLYLISQKKEDKTFGNAYSTSWALQALKALGDPPAGLATFQAEDGGLLENDSLNNRIWATAYAIPAALGKPWGDILQSFGKEAELLRETEVLLSIQQEVERIQLAVAELQPQVALLYNQYLASLPVRQAGLPKEQTVARINQEAELQMGEEAASTTQIASIAEALPTSSGLGVRQIVLLVIAGFAIFLLAGGTNLVSPLLRKLSMKV